MFRRPTRRAVLLALPALGGAGTAHALTTRPASSDEQEDAATSCRADAGHAANIELAILQLRRAGIVFDEAGMRATGRCPLCGCPAVRG